MLCQLLPYGILLQILFADKFGGMCLPGTFIFLLFVFICAEPTVLVLLSFCFINGLKPVVTRLVEPTALHLFFF
jgi:hypothetical protein